MSRSIRNFLFFLAGLVLPFILFVPPASAAWYPTPEEANSACETYAAQWSYVSCYIEDFGPPFGITYTAASPEGYKKQHFDFDEAEDCSVQDGELFCGPPPETEESCEEKGQYLDTETQSCVDSCPGIAWGGSCIKPPEPENECESSSPDFQGTAGWGDNTVPVCGGESTCGSGQKYQYFENADGSMTGGCVADDSGVPECPGGVKGMAVITEWGYTCQSVDTPEQPEAPNTDTDGDGTPDTYDRTNDPDAMGKGFDKLGDKMDKTNQLLTNLNNKAMGGGGGASGGGEGLKNEAGDDYLDGIEDNTKRSADNSDELNGALKPNGELTSTENTFGGITDQFLADVQGAPILSAFDAVSVSGACQVYEIDASAVGLGSYSFGYHCAFADQYGAWLGALMLGLYALAGIRIFTSA